MLTTFLALQKKCQEFENLKSLHEHLEEEKLNLFKQLQKVERKAKESESSYLTLQSVNVTLDAQISDFQKRHDNLTQDNLNKEKQIKVLNSQKGKFDYSYISFIVQY